RRDGSGQTKAFDEIVDERQVIEGLPRSKQRKAAAGEATEHPQEARISRSVDTNRTYHHHFRTAGLAELSRRLLGVELCVLVDVPGIEGRPLVRRRMRDVSVPPTGTAVHHSLDARVARRSQDVSRALDI